MIEEIKHLERFYGRRQGKKLRQTRLRLVDELLPHVQVTPETAPALAAASPDLWLEVGFGAGEHLAWQAAHHPHVQMIGCEPFINGVSKLLEYIDSQALENIRIFPDDARKLMDTLPDACLSRAFVLFNDPWPKKRHWHRRFINPANLDRLARLLKQGAELRIATDDQPLLFWTLDHIRAHGAFKWKVERCHEWLSRPADWPPTRYEEKALHGRPHFLTFIRK